MHIFGAESMSLRSYSFRGVKVYNVTAGESHPAWLSMREIRKKEKRLQKMKERAQGGSAAAEKELYELEHRIDLIQDLEFPSSSHACTVTSDGDYLISTGTYPPQIRVFSLPELSLKFSRHMDSECVDLCSLTSDWRKFVLLHNDRMLSFHAQFGKHFETRVPIFGRQLCYDSDSCDLLIAGTSSEIYRLNLEDGRFFRPFSTSMDEVCNSIDVCNAHGLIAVGGDSGLEMIDRRKSDPLRSFLPMKCGVSYVRFNPFDQGLTVGVGTEEGSVQLYDLRMPTAVFTAYHHRGRDAPLIRNLHFHSDGKYIISSCSRSVRVFDSKNGDLFTVWEPPGELYSVCPAGPKTGMFFVSGAFPRVQAYYVPSLGPAPRWCSFLDSLTEELEEGKEISGLSDEWNSHMRGFKFVTRDDLAQLGLLHLLGTSSLRAYMHGYFMSSRLYRQAVEASGAEMVDVDRVREEMIQDAVKKRRESRRPAAVEKKKVVNVALAKRWEKNKEKKDLLDDKRFTALFENPEFARDDVIREDESDE